MHSHRLTIQNTDRNTHTGRNELEKAKKETDLEEGCPFGPRLVGKERVRQKEQIIWYIPDGVYWYPEGYE